MDNARLIIELLYIVYPGKLFREICKRCDEYYLTYGKRFRVIYPDWIDWLYNANCDLYIKRIHHDLDQCNNINKLVIGTWTLFSDQDTRLFTRAKKLITYRYCDLPNMYVMILNTIPKFSDLSLSHNMINLTILHLSNACGRSRIYFDSEHIGNLHNLEELSIRNVGKTDISPIGRLVKLKVLIINYMMINDISPLSNLVCLSDLDLQHTSTSDVSPLAELTTLRRLYIYRSNIVDTSMLNNVVIHKKSTYRKKKRRF